MKVSTLEFDPAEMAELLRRADAAPELRGFVYPDDSTRTRLPIYYEDRLVGFATPRQDPDGIWRMGAIFVLPEWRGRGLAPKVIKSFMSGKRGRAFIEDENLASKRAYEKAGFRLVKSVSNQSGGWWHNF